MPDHTWLSDEEWQRVQRLLPIVCVDVLVARAADRPEVGLILRNTPHDGRAWCLVGGRLRRGEPVVDAARRELRSALGVEAVSLLGQPDLVVEYPVRASGPGPHDPRKHAIGLTFVTLVDAPIAPQGEAQDFAWYPVDALPAMGFGQDVVVGRLRPAVLRRTHAGSRAEGP